MDLKLTNKVALVTGSTAGIGFAIAQALGIEGAHVYVNGRTQERVDKATAAIRSHGATIKVDGVVADFSNSAGAETVIAKLPVVDVLVNNVGIFEPKPFAEIPDADWYRLFEVNVMSGVRLARHYLAGMLSKNWGRIIFISSESAVQIPPRDGALRDDQDGAGCRGARHCGVRGGHRGDRQQRPGGADRVRRCG